MIYRKNIRRAGFTIAVLYCFLFAYPAQGGWKPVLVDSTAGFSQAVFTDSLTGYIMASATPYPGLPILYKTEDGGQTWARKRFPYDTATEVPTIYAWGKHDIYLIGSHGIIASHGGDPLWQTVNSTKAHFGNFYYGLSWSGSIVRFSEDFEYLQASPDSGRTFISAEDQIFATRWVMPSSPLILPLFLDSATWIFPSKTPEGIATLVTTNAGKSWSYFHQSFGSQDSNLSYAPVKAPDGSSIWAYNVAYTTHKEGPADFLRSFDTGRTWVGTGTTLGPRSAILAPAGGDDIWASGTSDDSLSQTSRVTSIFHSLNGGASWNTDSTSIAYGQIKYLYFADHRHGWIVSDSMYDKYGVRRGMLVYRFIPDGLGVAASVRSESTLSVFPNPAASNISIAFRSSNTPDRIEIVDALGRIVYSSSNHFDGELRVDTRSFAKGYYCVRIRTRSETLSRSFLIVR